MKKGFCLFCVWPKPICATTRVLMLAAFFSLGSVLFSCHKRNTNTSFFKPMKPTGTMYSAYGLSGEFALEMDLNGDFFFQDFVTGFEFSCKSSEYIGKKESYKQKLIWNMFSGKELEQEVRFTVLQENCHNFGFINNPFILEVFHDGALIYRRGACGTFHEPMPLAGKYKMLTVNGKDALAFYKLKEIPLLELIKTNTSNMIHGRFACRYWQGGFKLLDKTMYINFNIHPTDDCVETPELTNLMEAVGNKSYLFEMTKDAKRRSILTLSDKYDTFVFLKID